MPQMDPSCAPPRPDDPAAALLYVSARAVLRRLRRLERARACGCWPRCTRARGHTASCEVCRGRRGGRRASSACWPPSRSPRATGSRAASCRLTLLRLPPWQLAARCCATCARPAAVTPHPPARMPATSTRSPSIPGRRRRGVASALLERRRGGRRQRRARRRRARHRDLDNRAARALYEAHGFARARDPARAPDERIAARGRRARLRLLLQAA